MIEELGPDEKQALALNEAKKGYLLFGEHYNYPNPGRIRAADAMGKRWPAIGEQGYARCASEGKYPGMLTDIIITLWLAMIKHASELTTDEAKGGAWTVERCCLLPQKAMEEALSWAEANGIALNDGPSYSEAYTVFWDIIGHERSVAYRIDVAGAGSAPPEDSNLV